jgi:preprotein translocase subunit SecG
MVETQTRLAYRQPGLIFEKRVQAARQGGESFLPRMAMIMCMFFCIIIRCLCAVMIA